MEFDPFLACRLNWSSVPVEVCYFMLKMVLSIWSILAFVLGESTSALFSSALVGVTFLESLAEAALASLEPFPFLLFSGSS